MFGAQKPWVHLARRYRFGRMRSYCSSTGKNGDKSSTSVTNSSNGEKAESSISTYSDAYKLLDKLDFRTAAEILVNGPSKEKKFG